MGFTIENGTVYNHSSIEITSPMILYTMSNIKLDHVVTVMIEIVDFLNEIKVKANKTLGKFKFACQLYDY